MPKSSELSIGQVAKRSGLSVSAIRFYEAEGLIHSERNRGGHRRYARDVIRRLAFVQIAKEFGFSLGAIRSQMDGLPDARTPTVDDWTKISVGFRAELTRRIDALSNMRDRLVGCIGCGCLSLSKCALYNPDDRAAAKGSGPRYLMGDRPSDFT
ncbi:MAG: redox-sensitive transcriptional activator SoxR [Pseudomonadota bacterium]